jgi:hypothetical protein
MTVHPWWLSYMTYRRRHRGIEPVGPGTTLPNQSLVDSTCTYLKNPDRASQHTGISSSLILQHHSGRLGITDNINIRMFQSPRPKPTDAYKVAARTSSQIRPDDFFRCTLTYFCSNPLSLGRHLDRWSCLLPRLTAPQRLYPLA